MSNSTLPAPAATSFVGGSEYTGLSVSTLRRMAKRGELPIVRLGRRVVLRFDDLDVLLLKHREAA